MAVRNSNAYVFDSLRQVLGTAAPPRVLLNDYPVDLYGEDLDVAEGAEEYMAAWQDHKSSAEFDASRSYIHNGRVKMFSGKRDYACRAGRWSSLSELAAFKMYKSYNSKMKDKDMGLLLPHLVLKEIHGDSKASFRLLANLSAEPYQDTEKRSVVLATAVARFASLYAAPTNLAVTDPHYKSMELLVSGSRSFAHLVHIESRLQRLLGLCKKVSKSSESKGLKTRLAKMVASHKWYNSDDDDQILDAYLNMAMGSGIKEPLDELDDEMDDYDDSGDYEKSDACAEMKVKILSTAQELRELGSRVLPVPMGGAETAFITRDGIMVVNKQVGNVLSVKDIGLCIELVQEAISSLADMLTSGGTVAGGEYHSSITKLWAKSADLTPDAANFMSCAHRDYELAVKQVDIKAFDRTGKYVTVEDCNKELSKYAKESSKVIKSYMESCPKGVTAYHWSRSMRCLPLCRFSPPLLVSEAKRAYDITHEPEDEALHKLRNAIVLQLGLCYKARHGVSPRGFDDALESVGDDRKLGTTIDAMDAWDYEGVADFDDTATIARDKSNIPYSQDILSSAKAYNSADYKLRREILYYEDKDKDRETKVAVQYFAGGAAKSVKAHLGVKPESKEGGRAVTSERSDIRKANTTITNNLLPYVDQIQGSLMAASPAKKERAVHEMVKEGKNLSGYVSYFLATDFVKFGHSLSHKLQKVAFEVVAKFFGKPWIENVPDMLLSQEVCCVYGDHFASFMNTTGGDGQGMRNAVWQLMLAGCLVFVNAELGGVVENIRSEKPLSLLYFMDDHLFRTLVKHAGKCFTKRRIVGSLLEKLNSIEDAICAAYKKVGLGTNEEKNTRSLNGAILTGMHISERGRENVPGRAIQRAYVETSHRAPSIVDIVANVAGSCIGAIEDGRHRASSMSVSIFLASLKVSRTLRSACKRNPALMGALLVTPVVMGGMGHPIEPDIVVQSGPNAFDDHLYNLYFHLKNKTLVTGAASAIYGTLSKSKKRKLANCGSVFTARHNSWLEAPSSTIRSYLRKTQLGSRFKKLDGMGKHLSQCMDYVESVYSRIPATVAKALVDAHPHTVASSELDRVVSSATSVMLLGYEDIQTAKRTSHNRSIRYLDKASKLTSTSTARHKNLSWEAFVWDLGQACVDVEMETPLRGPKFSLVSPCTDANPDLEARAIPKEDTYAILEPGSNASSASKGVELWCSMERSAVNTAVDLLVMASSCNGASAIGRVVSSMYGHQSLCSLQKVGTVDDPFRCLPSVQYCPQTSGYAVRRELQEHYVTAESMVSVRSSLGNDIRGHINHGAAIVVALAASHCCKSFVMTKLVAWTEPVFLVKSTKPRPPKLMLTGPKVASAMVLSLRGRVTAPNIEVFNNFTSSALDIYAYMSKSVSLNRKMRAIEKQAPIVPSGVHLSYLDPIALAITKEPASKQGDAVLKLLGIQVVERVLASKYATQCLGIIASAQRQMLNYLGSDDECQKWVDMLVPTTAEASEAFEVCKRACILQPMMDTLNRYYRAAKHAELGGVQKASPKSFIDFTKGAYKFWHRHLHMNMGELCSVGISYTQKANFSKSAQYWSTRHKLHYRQSANRVRIAKDKNQGVPIKARSELLTYEIKSKVMENLSKVSLKGEDNEHAYAASKKIIHNVYSRVTAKHLGKSRVTIRKMVDTLREEGELGVSAAIVHSLKKVAVALEMVANDLSIAASRPFPGWADELFLTEFSKIVGVHESGGHDRDWAESQGESTKQWVNFFKSNSIFGTSLDPIIDFSYWARELEVPATPFDSTSIGSIRLKSRTKVRYTQCGSSVSSGSRGSHSRSSYGVETHPGRRHAVGFIADPTDVALRRLRDLSPLTLPSQPSLRASPTSASEPEQTEQQTIINDNTLRTLVEETPALPQPALATRQTGRRSRRLAGLASTREINLASDRDWTDIR